MKRVTSVLLLLLAGSVVVVAVGAIRWRQAHPAGFYQSERVVLARATAAAPGGLMILGDSIVAQQQIDRLCGLPVLNAGIAGARARHFVDLAPKIVARARPTRVVVALGTNDVRGPHPTPAAAFSRQMDRILKASGPRPIVVGVAVGGAAELNRRLSIATQAKAGTFVTPPPAALTVDGVHPSVAGEREWRRRVEAACG